MAKKRFIIPTEIIFGQGSIENIKDIVRPADHVFIVTDPGIEKAGIVAAITDVLKLAGSKYTIFNNVEPNPSSSLALSALEELKQSQATMVLAVGGGSPLDLGKIIAALSTNEGPLEDYQWNNKPFAHDALPFVAIPTTAGTGSEVTKVAVIVDRNAKKGINSDKLFPKYAILDPNLMTGLPPHLTAATGMDALTHAVEAYVGKNTNPFTDSFALEAIKLIKKSLVKACKDGKNIEARMDMLWASTLAGLAMDQGGLGIVHSMAGPFCGIYHLPHGDANAILLKYGMEFNVKHNPGRFAKIAEILGSDIKKMSTEEAAFSSVDCVKSILAETGLKVDLFAYGMKESDGDVVAEQTTQMYLINNNPYKPSVAECKALYLHIYNEELKNKG